MSKIKSVMFLLLRTKSILNTNSRVTIHESRIFCASRLFQFILKFSFSSDIIIPLNEQLNARKKRINFARFLVG